jgi:fatty acid desaturase
MVVLSNFVVVFFPFLLKPKLWKFDRPSTAFMDSLNPNYHWKIRLEGLAAITTHAAIVWFLQVPILSYAMIYFAFGFSWSAMQYVHHFGTERHVLRGTRNLWLFGPVDLIWLHHNWHAVHHHHPTLPWIYLPQVAREEADEEADDGREFLLWHYLRMWRGPRHTSEHVENKFAGKVIQ